MDSNLQQKVDERVGGLELELETLRVLIERRLRSFSADSAVAEPVKDGEVVAFVRETRERIDAVANQLENVLPDVRAFVADAMPDTDQRSAQSRS